MVSAWRALGAGQASPGQHAASLVAVDGFVVVRCAGGADQHEQGRRGDGLGATAELSRRMSLSSRRVPFPWAYWRVNTAWTVMVLSSDAMRSGL
jgi:hypothetical protein